MIPLGLERDGVARAGPAGRRPATRSAGSKADSREVGPGDLFVALNTGVRYVDEARARGAATLVPDDQEVALAALAALVRSKSDAQVVAVVGSAGKTTTKDILGALCAPHAPTIWAERSLNNEIGLPLTVCRLEPRDGGPHHGDGDARARPDRGALRDRATERRRRPAHRAGAPRAPRHASSAWRRRTPRRSRRCRPAAWRSCLRARRARAVSRRATTSTIRRVRPGDIAVPRRRHAVHGRERDGRARAARSRSATSPRTHSPRCTPTTRSGCRSSARRTASPASDALAVAGRGAPAAGGGFVVNDAYNANPDSMRAALEHLAERAGERRKVAILGEMAELGERARRIPRRDRRARRVSSGSRCSELGTPPARTSPSRGPRTQRLRSTKRAHSSARVMPCS